MEYKLEDEWHKDLLLEDNKNTYHENIGIRKYKVQKHSRPITLGIFMVIRGYFHLRKDL